MAATVQDALAPWIGRDRAHGPRTTAVWLATLGLGLALAWSTVRLAGGTHSAWPHLFYLPVVLAALPFGRKGALVVAMVAGLLCGPLMPLDAARDLAQPVANWTARSGFFLAVGLLAGTMVETLRRTVQSSLADRLDAEFALSTSDPTLPEPGLGRRIRQVLETRAFHPVFQPIYSLSDGRLLAVEALSRFDAEPAQPPNIWFEQAEQVGMGRDLDLAAIAMALQATSSLPDHVALHVNAGPATLRDQRLPALLATQPSRHVIIEVTEHVMVEDYSRLEAARRRLRECGAALAVDDAGAGFASFRHIIRLAPEVIKLDQTLTRNLRHDPVLRALAEAFVHFAHRTGTQLVIEGLEEEADLRIWQRLGAHAAQGYLLAKPGPLPAADHCPKVSDARGKKPSPTS